MNLYGLELYLTFTSSEIKTHSYYYLLFNFYTRTRELTSSYKHMINRRLYRAGFAIFVWKKFPDGWHASHTASKVTYSLHWYAILSNVFPKYILKKENAINLHTCSINKVPKLSSQKKIIENHRKIISESTTSRRLFETSIKSFSEKTRLKRKNGPNKNSLKFDSYLSLIRNQSRCFLPRKSCVTAIMGYR